MGSEASRPMVVQCCAKCKHWGEFGLCKALSGIRVHGDVSWHQTVTTDANDDCAHFTAKDHPNA